MGPGSPARAAAARIPAGAWPIVERMPYGAERALTDAEWSTLSPGLAEALARAGVQPRIVARPAIGARIAALWRGGRIPVLAWKDRVFWPGALSDFSGPENWRDMALLQHELHHLWEYAVGDLTPLGYGLRPRHWRYRYQIGPQACWADFGAEQRACIAEDLWLIDNGHVRDPAGRGPACEMRRRLLPWSP